jgi:hypothetical protein
LGAFPQSTATDSLVDSNVERQGIAAIGSKAKYLRFLRQAFEKKHRDMIKMTWVNMLNLQ